MLEFIKGDEIDLHILKGGYEIAQTYAGTNHVIFLPNTGEILSPDELRQIADKLDELNNG